MKSALKPPFKPSGPAASTAGATPARRPGFPVRLEPDAGTPSATKKVAGRAHPERDTGIFDSKKPVKTVLTSGVGLDSRAVRTRMVSKLAAQGISDAQVLAAMGHVERHRFVDTALVNQAYEDTSLPIGLGQTISKPNVVARMLELLRQGAGSSGGKLGRVLEIGTGCGYQAALLGQLATEVYSIERLRGLHDKARENLRAFRLANVHLLFGDGMAGYAKGAPYAAIIAAAGGEAIPPAWVEQLAVGGRLVAPMHVAGGAQALVVLDRTANGVTQTVLEAVHFVPLKSGTS
ncbi:MAG: protein-L-isoaspartate(D-aspartate) O-methyltransferase [Polaromonas sp.]|uniref:protein-L-isoaspartate(D-aspartate) O-methyltransferase n=1 Tax=Polaromonas sp. TaxID=1869339 RepID=UPI002725F1F6|nr:protein-L-isoaspartate(D-aspartate) O-methyltransferase [Polaromonas sp.]MDO9113259.1 protein-L-isoaspartate(D-aspartate) O-methyltransferase [Polaromonas sp.]MDP1889100.1 protein-L-isoaspartate(D-aspartate) O-methyltransferase [Polaromonas sp.]